MKTLWEMQKESGVAVWSYNRQEFIQFVPCPGEKRVRIDVYDGLENYAVYEVVYHENQTFDLKSRVPLKDWTIDWT